MRTTHVGATVLICLCTCLAGLAQTQDAPADRIREQSIYIPYEKLQETFEKEGRGVFVPYERFQELWKRARASDTKRPETAVPVKAMITEVRSVATVESDVVRVHADVKIDLLDRGWLTIPLRLSDAAVLSAQLGEEPARLIAHQGGQALLIKKENVDAEQVELKLVYAKAFTKAPGRNSVSFQSPRAPVNRWEIHVPDQGVKVNVFPMLATTEVPPGEVDESAGKGDGTVVLAFVGAAPEVKIDWTPKAEGATGLDALVGVQTDQRLRIEEGITRTYATLTYDISRAELSQLRVEVPSDQKVVNILDANVRGWQVMPQGNTQLVTIDLFQPARKQQKLAIELERFRETNAQGEVVAPVVKAVGVGRQRGVVVLQVTPGLRAEAVRREGLSQMGTAELKTHTNEPVDASYRYAALPFELAFQVEKVQPRIAVDQLAEMMLTPRKLDCWLTLKYDIQKAGVFELACDVPRELVVEEVRGVDCAEAKAVEVESFAKDPSNPDRLRINLNSKAEGRVGLMVRLSRPLEAPNLLTPTGETEILNLSPPRASGDLLVRSEGSLVIYAPESLRLSVDELNRLRSVSVKEATQAIPSSLPESVRDGRRAVLAFAFSDEAATAQVSAERRRPQVTAEQLLIAKIEANVVKYEAGFYFDVRYSGVDSLRVDLPTVVAQKYRNETSAVRDQVMEPSPDDLAEGYTAIELVGDTELLGQQYVRFTWEETVNDLAIGSSVDIDVPVLVPRNVVRADGQVVLVKAETIDVRPKNNAEGLDPIDPQLDLLRGADVPNAVAALEFRNSDWDLTLTATRYQLENLKHTSIEHGVLRMVITRSERVAVQALYRMRSNLQRLEVELPYDVAPGQLEFDTEPLRINGRAVTLERGQSPREFFVPLVGYATNEPFLLELRFTMPGHGERLRYPYFPNEPATQRMHLLAFLPSERDFVGRDGPWAPEMAWRTGEFFQRRYLPQQDVGQLVRDLQKDITVIGNPASDFPVQGTPLLFTTLRPLPPDDGALELKTVDRKLLDAMVLVGSLTLGVLLLSQSYVIRFVVCCGTLGGAILLGVFAPTLAGQVLDQTMLIAVILVALLWVSVSLLQFMGDWRARPRPALATAGGPAVAAESSAVPDPPTRPEQSGGQASATDESVGEEGQSDE